MENVQSSSGWMTKGFVPRQGTKVVFLGEEKVQENMASVFQHFRAFYMEERLKLIYLASEYITARKDQKLQKDKFQVWYQEKLTKSTSKSECVIPGGRGL